MVMYKFIAPDPVATALISKLLDGDLRDLLAKWCPIATIWRNVIVAVLKRLTYRFTITSYSTSVISIHISVVDKQCILSIHSYEVFQHIRSPPYIGEPDSNCEHTRAVYKFKFTLTLWEEANLQNGSPKFCRPCMVVIYL